MRPVRMGPDPGASLGRDEVDDHGGEADLVRQTPRPDRLLEALKVASIVESVGRVPTGSRTPAPGTSALSDTTPEPVQSSHPGGDKAQAKRAEHVAAGILNRDHHLLQYRSLIRNVHISKSFIIFCKSFIIFVNRSSFL